MMRIGAAIAESVPFRVAHDADRIAVFDDTPGWVGDSSVDDEALGTVALGGAGLLHARRRYEAFAIRAKVSAAGSRAHLADFQRRHRWVSWKLDRLMSFCLEHSDTTDITDHRPSVDTAPLPSC